ncbi:glycosyltransferase family 4 protein [Microbacterium sp. KSW4-11]|uniref:Glycosyltransferase family 4 protein n=1 Tax=Microbacterium gawkjiense TaxID=3067309 RepID=A0ABU3GA78_9MICO|nr:glycosyltransferase family 4 protein [Microbacterium sp. KSW4-11]MDT3316720.1 glycosyltransferase family 4 protein [Microbacterium sp. KSW4-11]
MTETLLRVLRESGYSVELASRPFSVAASEVGRASVSKVLRIPIFISRIYRVCRAADDGALIFFVTNRPASFLVDCAAAALIRLLGVRRVDYVHTVGFADLAKRGRVWRSLVRWFIAGADETVCLTNSLASDLEELSASKITIIPNTVPDRVPLSRFENRDRSRVRVALFMSNLLPEKGASTFVRLASVLAARLPDVVFRLAGSSNDDRILALLRHQIDEAQMSERIFLLGHVDGEKKWEELAAADVLVFPSEYRFEAQPLTILEAGSVGTATVAYGVGGIPETLAVGLGEAVTPGAFDELVSSVERTLSRARIDDDRLDIADSYAVNFGEDVFRDRWTALLGNLT